jgi:hypothetical protein
MNLGLGLSLTTAGMRPVTVLPRWSPEDALDTGTLLAWYEPSPDTVALETSGAGTPAFSDDIAHLADRSGAGHHMAMANASKRPSIEGGVGGPPPHLHFDGSNDLLQTPGLAPGLTSLTLVVAGDFKVSGDRQYAMMGPNDNSPNADLLILALANNNERMGLYDGTAWRDFETNTAPAGPQVASFRLDITTGIASGYRDGAPVGSTVWSPQALTGPVCIMGRDDSGDYLRGDLHFMALYAGALSETDRARVEGYARAILPRRLAMTGPVQVGTDVHASQGVAIDPRGFLFTSAEGASGGQRNKMITTYAWDGAGVGAPLHAFNGVDAMSAPATQVNGLFFDTDTNRLYSGANNWTGTPATGHIVEYDVAADGSLSYRAEHPVGAHYCEGCAKYAGFWWVIYHDRHEIHQYDLAWTFVAAHALPLPDPGDASVAGNYYQGIAWRDDVAYVNVHGANANAPRMLAYRWTGSAFVYAAEMTPPANATQGFVFDGDDHMVMAVRTQSNASPPNHVVRVGIERL